MWKIPVARIARAALNHDAAYAAKMFYAVREMFDRQKSMNFGLAEWVKERLH